MKKIFLLITIWFCLSQVTAQTTYSNEVEEQIKQVENNLAGRVKIDGKTHSIAERMAFFNVKGLSIAVINNYKVVWAKGYGWADEKEKRLVTPQTLFEPGSISKSLNAVGILKLVQDKKLDLNVDINTYLKSWKFPYDSLSKNKKITLANLLSHTAGLNVHGFPGYDRKAKIPTVPKVLDGKQPANTPAVRSEFEPGLKFQYSGGGTTISQLIITDVTGQPYDKFMYENVLKPMGMTSSFYSQPPHSDKLKLVATGYYRDGNEVGNKFHVYPEQGAAGLWMTPTDLCNYIIETQLAYEGKSSKVLTPEMTKLRLTPYIDKSAALGVFILEKGTEKYFVHDAGNEGFCGVYFGSLEGGNGVAVFLNTDNGSILQELVNSVATVYNWKDFYKPVIKKEIEVPEPVLAKYAGTYVFDGLIIAILKKADGYYYLTDGIYSKMHFTTEKDFFNEEFSSEKTFLADGSGNVSGFLRSLNGESLSTAIKITNTDSLTAAPGQINTMAWYLLENKQFDNAITFLKRGITLAPNDLAAIGNLAHCYLFKNDYATALKLYKEFLAKAKESNSGFKNMIGGDFVIFKNKGFDTSLMDKVFTDLKLKIPDAYKSN
ncbi:MAG: serine hydrolase [Bacteroidia bacterium]|nr:serine hydrolase [Bacteroidia bacterium]